MIQGRRYNIHVSWIFNNILTYWSAQGRMRPWANADTLGQTKAPHGLIPSPIDSEWSILPIGKIWAQNKKKLFSTFF